MQYFKLRYYRLIDIIIPQNLNYKYKKLQKFVL